MGEESVDSEGGDSGCLGTSQFGGAGESFDDGGRNQWVL